MLHVYNIIVTPIEATTIVLAAKNTRAMTKNIILTTTTVGQHTTYINYNENELK